jgi:hypothetical protein
VGEIVGVFEMVGVFVGPSGVGVIVNVKVLVGVLVLTGVFVLTADPPGFVGVTEMFRVQPLTMYKVLKTKAESNAPLK